MGESPFKRRIKMLIYLTGIFLCQIICLWKASEIEFKTIAIISYLWPISIPFIVAVFIIDLIGWVINVESVNKWAGFRKPKDNWPGFAITLCKFEVQIFKNKK